MWKKIVNISVIFLNVSKFSQKMDENFQKMIKFYEKSLTFRNISKFWEKSDEKFQKMMTFWEKKLHFPQR